MNRRAPAGPRHVAHRLWEELNNFAQAFEESARSTSWPETRRPVFIVGPPRSGTTLLYQSLVHSFAVGYTANIHCLLYGGPSLVERALRPSRRGSPVRFRSANGRTAGLRGPSECGEYWYRFFPRDPTYVRSSDLSHLALSRLRTSVGAMLRACSVCVVYKNTYNSLRLEPISVCLPEALFVVVRRGVLDVARSLLAGRHRVLGSYEAWWGVRPPGPDLSSRPPHEQAVEQVVRINDVIDRDTASIGSHRFLQVQYEDLVQDPRSQMIRVRDFMDSHGSNLATRFRLPTRFDTAHERLADASLDRALVEYVEYIEGMRRPT